ncbi:MAG TPA: CehA/McbA family metallohydrolase, partial [Methylomirabilota bacterium]|nr:CehA/McbA family metallohydrolase [Methylomirabilota bacterium]
QVRRLIESTDYLGSPFDAEAKRALAAALKETDTARAIEQIQKTLDAHCLFLVAINPELRVKVAPGPARPELVEQGWRQFLVKVTNDAGTTSALRADSPNARRLHGSPREEVADRWLDLMMFDSQPMTKTLSGLALEYRIVQLYSRDAGKREARIGFNVGQGTQDLGFRSEVDLLFDCLSAHPVTLRVKDENGAPTVASFVIRDPQGRVYPSQAKRLAPDFAFHPQVYRGDGEMVKLPAGTYTVEFSRGPESLTRTRTLTVTPATTEASFQVERWIDPSKHGWWSGDHHIHAAGCAHYVKPTEGVHAEDMIRHVMGEDLKVGANLTWGPCFDYQKQFFCGAVDKVSKYPYLLRYDIEVSGFGSHQSGHLCLLRLRDQIYPGGDSKDHWPTLGLNTLRWAKKQGAVTGPAHSGWGLEVKTKDLPNYEVPPFNAIGANEYIVDVTHEVPGPDGKLVPAVDFISTVDTPYVWELNIWYHTLNSGFRTRISGETDFPCIYGEKVGLGRSYVNLGDKLDYDAWCEGIREGRSYVSEGKSHLIDFKINGHALGEAGSELKLPAAGRIKATAKVAALLNERPDPTLQNRDYTQKPYWDIERARIGPGREVPVELVVNGYPVAKKNLVADGRLREIEFDAAIERSSWVALRILPSSHTNPIFVLVDGKPIRASRRSVEWCLKGVEQCWKEKQRFIKPAELEDAMAAYAHARATYQRLLAECEVD